MNDERDYAEEQANQKLLEEGDEPEKLFKYTLTFTAKIPDDNCYPLSSYLRNDVVEANIELPIDTPEKKAKLEEYWIRTGTVSVLELMGEGKLEAKVEVVDG